MQLGRTPDDVLVEAVASHRLQGPASEVWPLIRSPRAGVVLQRRCIDAWIEPGSPSGVGEIQVYRIRMAGLLPVDIRTEVIAYEDGKRAVTKALDGLGDACVETTLSDEDADGFVVLRLRSWHVVPAGRPMRTVRSAQRHLDKWAADIAARLPLLRTS